MPPVPPKVSFPDVLAEVDRFIGTVSAYQPTVGGERERNLLGAVLDRLKEARDHAAKVVPEGLNTLKGSMENLQQATERLKEQIARQQAAVADLEAKARAAAAPALPPPPAAPPTHPHPPPIDPALGERLRNDLLGAVTPPPPPKEEPFHPGKDIWQDWQ